jgi:imidazolonepropionase-like amidohydrolase
MDVCGYDLGFGCTRPAYDATVRTNRCRVALCVAAWLVTADLALAMPGASLTILCGAVFDGSSDSLLGPTEIRIADGRIESMQAAPAAPVPPMALDLRAHTCLPGLIDLHVHLTEMPQDTADLKVLFRRTRAEQNVLSAAHAAATVLAGFTTVRNVGAYIRGVDLMLRDAIVRGEMLGPRMQVSGFYLTIPGGGGDLLLPDVPERATPLFLRGGVARGEAEFRRKAELALTDGADLLKVIASGAVLAYGGVPGAPEMNRSEIATVVSVAHAKGYLVAAHAHGAQSIRDAILAGVDTIEHASLIDADGIALARQQQTVLVMDIYNGDYIDTEGRAQGWPAEFLRKNIETTEAQRQGFTRAHRAGARIAFGTDAGVFPHGMNARQFRIMVERGMTPVEALRAATSIAARAMGWGDRVGALRPGMAGDLIAVRGDPLRDVRLLERVEAVVLAGRLVKGL